MQEIFNRTYSDISNWKSDLKKYKEEKQTLGWGKTEKPKEIKNKEIYERDAEFNPILQKYKDSKFEDQLKLKEKRDLCDALVTNKDSSLKKEQTYDIINLENKIQGLKTNKNIKNKSERNILTNIGNIYPGKTERAKSNMLNSRVNYNLLSNITVDKHSSIQPENRQVITHVPSPKRIHKVNANYYREYDIISNNYKEFHKEKTQVNNEVSRIETAIKYNKINDYNPISAEFYDKGKEKEFQDKTNDKILNWEKDHIKSKYKLSGYLYNPINMSVINEPGLREADSKAKNKKKRYQLRNMVDYYYHNNDIERTNIKEERKLKRISYNRYKIFDDRGFDILNQNKINEKDYKMLNPKNKDLDNNWEKLVHNAGESNTYNEKKIYKEPHDYSEMALTMKQFMVNRKNLLEKLPKIFEDSTFNKKSEYIKIKNDNERAQLNHSNHAGIKEKTFNLTLNKAEWFSNNKNHDYDESKVEKINYHQNRYIATPNSEIKSRPSLFVENKLKKVEDQKICSN